MESKCRFCGEPILIEQNVLRDSFGVNMEVHAECLNHMPNASAIRIRALKDANQ